MLDVEALRPFVRLMEGEITYDIHSMTYHVRVRLGGGRTATVALSATDSLDLALLVLSELANTRLEESHG